ncbi:flagellar hook-associated protein FlgK [Octadecabacter sp. 1_MG-2023]|uniref:flagellar hook-associated protein FlgK n=1 Tax=unclassified Octadecabacter TaxID=196158 RepID=UPI001C07F37E|nr:MULTISPECIES: flagellar hook-associated protein FlgK [unclassified Octadecabacter]MBU2992366.1 flagellar hook-associated protein FlgK [Octadecabacter sp. B2R22]MDO6734877.1 flagellar hook-associated protein FlgK [Octadecabacter sp. 1_MG-2023]
MSISNSLSNALSGMNAASRTAEVVSSNLANSLTEGYGRRTLSLTAASIGGQGAGVEIGSVIRHVDRGILSDRRLAESSLGGYGSLVSTMSQVEDTVGRTGEDGSISSNIVALEASLVDAASDPSSTIGLSTLGNRLSSVAQSLNDASSAVQTLREEADASIADQVDLLNTRLSQVERLNADITYSRNTGGDPSSLLDQRQQVIDDIAEIVPIRELDRDGGQVALMTPDGEMLLDGKAKEFGFAQNNTIVADMTFAGGGLSGITVDGQPIASDGVGKLVGGSLGAAFQARDAELVTVQDGLDNIAADLMERFQDPNVDPTLAIGEAGLFTDAGSAFDIANSTGLAGRISVNAAVDPDQGGTLTNLRDGINATTSGPSGDASLLQALSSALTTTRSTTSDPVQQSAAGRASSLEASVGSQRLEYESELSFATARWTSLQEAEAANGVDSDYEMQMLLRVEQAYAANARVVQAVETMMQSLMEL